jgi:iron(III) transport system substrate-binding protein
MQADLFDGSTTMFPLIEAGLVANYLPPSASTLPAEFKDKDGHWAALNVLFLTAAYNTELVKKDDAPKTLADLLNPKWKGKIAWTSEPNVNGPPGFIGNVLRAMGQDKGMEFLRALAAQKIVNVPAAQRVVLDQVIAGEYPLCLMIFNHHSAISAAQGAPVQWIKMEPLVATMNYISMVKAAPHPNAAKLLMEFMLSDEGQQVLAGTGYLPSQPHIPAKRPELKPEQGGFKTTIISPADTLKHVAEWTKIYETLFK